MAAQRALADLLTVDVTDSGAGALAPCPASWVPRSELRHIEMVETMQFSQPFKRFAEKIMDNSNDPQQHTQHIVRMLDELIAHVRKDIGKINEPRAQVLFETTAEVLTGLKTAYEHYEAGTETAIPPLQGR